MRVCLLILTLAVSQLAAAGGPAIDIGNRLEVFVDGYLIDSMKGASLRLHAPREESTAIVFDQPWEGNTSTYCTVIKDEDRYRLYYRGSSDPAYTPMALLRPGERVVPVHEEVTCYAESKDGIRWTRPSLGIVEFQNSRANNIILGESAVHNFAPFKDANPAAAPGARYKAVGGSGKLFAYQSADGVRWTKTRAEPVITDGKFDSLNVAFYDTVRGEYVAVYRDFRHGIRTVKFATSKDFLNWTPGVWADYGPAPLEQLYTNATTPYFRAPHIYLSFPKRFVEQRTPLAEAPGRGVSETVFMTSRDGIHWDRRFMEALIRPGRDPRNWIHRSTMAATNLVPTAADEMSLYVDRDYNWPTNRLVRYSWRTDGLVSVHAGAGGGEMLTKPFTFQGATLVLNYATSAAGGIRMEIQDERGNPMPGFGIEDAKTMFGDKIEETVGVKSLKGATIRLRFVMKDADLYSIQFR
jgi:hypothetical protein